MLGSSGVFSRNLPVFDGKKFNNWCLKMNAIFDFQEVEEVFKNGFQEIGRNATKEQKAEYKELKKLNSKAGFQIHQGVNVVIFGKMSKATTTKQVRDILNKAYGGADKTKKVKRQNL